MARGMKSFQGPLRAILAPRLREHGFQGSGTRFGRYQPPVINCIRIQGRSDGTSCCVNLGITFDFVPDMRGRDPGEFDESACEFRTRLTPRRGQHDYWWAYSLLSSLNRRKVKHIADCFDKSGRPFFDLFAKFPEPFSNLTVDEFKDGKKPSCFPDTMLPTRMRQMLISSFALKHIGKSADAAEIARMALAELGESRSAGRGLVPHFEEVLNKRDRR